METGNGKKKTNAPPLRFPGFRGEWEERNLSDFVTENKERNIKGYFDKTNVLSVSGDYGIVNQIELLGRSFAGTRVSQYRVVRHGNIVYTKSPLKEYPYGIVKANMGDDGIVSTLYAVYKVNGNADEKFIQYYFSLSSRINKYFKPIVRIGAKHDMKIGNQEVLANRVVFPSLSEQRKIADFLRLLDERIAVQRALIGEMGRLMKGLNDYLNTKADKEFVLGDIGVFIRGLTFSNNDISDDGVCVLRSVNIQNTSYANYTDNIIYVNKSITPEQELRKGDIVICMANGSASLVGKNSVYEGNYSGRITVGAFCGIFRSSNRIARWLLQTSYYRGAVCRLKQGGNGAISNINGEDLMRLHFKSLQDSRVYYVLDLLSEKLNVLRMQLFKYQKQKEYFLQKMFL